MSEVVPPPNGEKKDIYSILRARILDLQLPPDSKVTIDAIAREMNVSHTPVREALRQLEGDNLIVKAPRRGYRTTSLLNFDQLRELFELRLLIEPWAARSAATNSLSNPSRALSSELEGFLHKRDAEDNIRHSLVTHDMQFHDHILQASRNTFVHQAIETTHSHLHLFRLYPGDWTGEQTVGEHRLIAEAIQACDPDAAEQAMRDHLMGAYYRFAGAFEKHEDVGPRPVPITQLY